jgi:hypothetical protein
VLRRRRLEFEIYELAFRGRHDVQITANTPSTDFTPATMSKPRRHRSSRATYHSSVGPKLVAGRASGYRPSAIGTAMPSPTSASANVRARAPLT